MLAEKRANVRVTVRMNLHTERAHQRGERLIGAAYTFVAGPGFSPGERKLPFKGLFPQPLIPTTQIETATSEG
jgi:hypothetical protein